MIWLIALLILNQKPLIEHETECLIYASRLASREVEAVLYDSGNRAETGSIIGHLVEQGIIPSVDTMPSHGFQTINGYGRINTLFFSDELGHVIVTLNIDTGAWCAFLVENDSGVN